MHLFQVSYSSDNVVEGKRAAKEALQQRLGLKTSDLPLIGVITRLTNQKGIHLIKHAIWRTLDRNGQVIFLYFYFFIDLYYECPFSAWSRLYS
jgi:starch synthase